VPGFIVAHRIGEPIASALSLAFHKTWGRPEKVLREHSLVLGHAFEPSKALLKCAGDGTVVVDGESAIYPALAAAEDLASVVEVFASTGLPYTGNVLLVNHRSSAILAVTDWTGTFPLYWWHSGDRLIVSSHLRPLARALGATWDDHAIVQTLRFGYTISARTPYAGIQRLLPGQAIRFDGHATTITETSRAWQERARPHGSRNELRDEAWSHLRESVSAGTEGVGKVTLMMSGGWDSRTLLAAASDDQGVDVECYTHGDLDSREHGIVRSLCAISDVPLHAEPIDDSVLDLAHLHASFDRIENVVFPHWHRAGRLIAGSGSRVVMAGVYGEVIGGHYGESMVRHGLGKMWSVASALLGVPGRSRADRRTVEQLLAWRPHVRPWYLAPDFPWDGKLETDQNNADTELALERLEQRGVSDPMKLLEAFVTETRGSRYINMQIASCRARLDVALPFAHRDALLLASQVPTRLKTHNVINRRILQRHAPHLLTLPLAATLIPARYPLIAQEASRLARRLLERGRGARQHDQPRYSWVNFDFLRTGRALRLVLQDLRSALWDRAAIEQSILALEQGQAEPHPMYDQMAKILSVDLMLR
jgi:hypothetical protein